MPWKSASGAAPNKLGTTRSKSIRGQISAPIPVPDPMEQDAIDNNAQNAAANQPETTTEKLNSSPPSSRPVTIAKPPSEQATKHASTVSSAAQGTNRLSKSTTATAAQPERKKSTIRKVFGKIFGKGKKSPSRTSKSSYVDEAPSHPQHRSDPTGDTKPPLSESLEARANSVPVTEYDRALRSHSIGPEDVLAIQSARNSLAAEHSLAKKRTGTSSPHAFGARYIGGGKLAGLSPRPASVNDRYDGSSYDVADPNEIGRAITSDNRGLKRRSRSLSAIPDFEAPRPRRHRSDDLRFWRDSYDVDFLSPLSSNFPEDDVLFPRSDALGIETVAGHEEPITPAQQFDFGAMAITRDVNHPTTIEDAVASKGVPHEGGDRFYQLQDAMARLDGSAQSYATPPTDWNKSPNTGVLGLGINHSVAPSSTTADYQSRSMDMHASSRPSSRSSVNDTLASSRGLNKPPQALAAPKSTTRPMSENTVTERETMIFDNSKKPHGPFTEEHYATLLGLLETERSARMALEAQVRLLTHQVTVLMNHAGPGDDTELAPGGGASVSTTSAFDDDDDDDTDNEGKRYDGHGYGRKMLDDSGFGADVRDEDDESTESFATPHEDQDRTFGIYPNEDEALDEHAPRALSLSQMTMGRMQMQATVV